jgi:hypothetical protein
MISKKTRVERLRRHKDLKAKYEVKLVGAETDAEKRHYEARIAEVVGNIKATELPKSKALLPAITKTAEEDAKKAEEDIVHPLKPQSPTLKRTDMKKVKNVGNPF